MVLSQFSVAMATYNGAAYIGAQLDSIAAQSRLPIELVIGDDGSSDETLAIAEAFAARAPFPVRIVRNPARLGFADNFLCTAERCTGDWIAFSDQDDVWYPHKLARIAAEIDQRADPDLVMVCHVADVVDETLTKTGRQLPAIERTRVDPPNSQPGFWCVGGCVMVVRGDLVREIDFRRRPPDDFLPASLAPGGVTALPHDKWMCVLANALGSTLFLAEALGSYRRHGTTVTGNDEAVPIDLRWRKAAATGGAHYRFRAGVAHQTADALRALGQGLGKEQRERMRVSAEKFDAIEGVLSRRASLYAGRGRGARLRQLAVLTAMGAYHGDRFSSLGMMSLMKDLWVSVVGAPGAIETGDRHGASA